MKEELKKLNAARNKLDILKDKKQIAYDKYLLENKELFNEIERIDGIRIECEDFIRKEALSLYKETGNKQLDFGVGIRIMKKLEYNETSALGWAKKHDMALKLDVKAFEKIAKADPMDFVLVSEVPMATLPVKIEVKE